MMRKREGEGGMQKKGRTGEGKGCKNIREREREKEEKEKKRKGAEGGES